MKKHIKEQLSALRLLKLGAWLTLLIVVLFAANGTAYAAALTYTVNSTADTDDGTCNAADCTLREAINAANAHAGKDIIKFNIAGAGPHTIAPTSALPMITGPVVIDATKAEGNTNCASKTLHIILDGTNAGDEDGLVLADSPTPGIDSRQSQIKGLVIQNWDKTGIHISNPGGNVITCNLIGLDQTGTTAAWNLMGILIENSPNNIIGGTTAAARNIISGNESGLFIGGAPSMGNKVMGNFIGTNKTGTAAVANNIGVMLFGAVNNTIGGTVAGSRNVISGNNHGVQLDSATANKIQGNYIGTNAAGTGDLGNLSNGIWVTNNSLNTLIGGTSASARNVISGNGNNGVLLDAGSTGTTIQGNFIGTDKSGTIDLGNDVMGIAIDSSNSNLVGGGVTGAGNVISGNDVTGLTITTSDANIVQGNTIGTNAAGTVALGNTGYGIWLTDATNNTLGGTIAGARNLVSGNTLSGVVIGGAASTGNTVMGNYIGTNRAGTAAIPNNQRGVEIDGSATNNMIGGTASGAGNLISGNTGDGIFLNGGTGNQVQGNLIGTDATGMLGVGNNFHGIEVNSTSNNTIGGAVAGARNVISGNADSGVILISATGTVIQGNYIGTDKTGMNALGNGSEGVWLFTGSNGTSIGGTGIHEGNLIAGNASSGIFVAADTAAIHGNTIGMKLDGSQPLYNGNDGITVNGVVDTQIGDNLIAGNGSHALSIGAPFGGTPGDNDNNCILEGGLQYIPTTVTVFENNWWGAADGSSGDDGGSGSYGGGIYVDTDPWLTSAPDCGLTPAGTDLLVNGNVETDANANLLPDNWTASNLSVAGGEGMVSTQAHGGTYSVQMNGGGSANTLSQTVVSSGPKGQTMLLKFWLRTNGISGLGMLRAQIKVTNNDGTVTMVTRDLSTADADFMPYMLAITSTKPYKSLKVILTFRVTTGSVWWDDVSLLRIN